MSGLSYRLWREGDDLELLQLWGDPERSAEDRALLRESSDEPFVRTIVAEDAGIPVAAGVISEASVHPERIWAYVEVARDHRRNGVGTALLERLRAESRGAKLRAKVTPGSPGAAFAGKAGLRPLQRSRIVRVDAGALVPVGLGEDSGDKIEDLATGSVELTGALRDFYRAVHHWDPPADLGLGRVNQLFLSEAAGARGAVVLRIGGKIRAFAISYERADPEAAADVLLGYVPGGDADSDAHSTEQAVTERAVRTLLALLVHQYPVELELDDSMKVLRGVVDPLIEAGTAAVVRETLVVSD